MHAIRIAEVNSVALYLVTSRNTNIIDCPTFAETHTTVTALIKCPQYGGTVARIIKKKKLIKI
jgi:hypothetical protein